ncbi:hypothetical protein MSL71_17290 [Desulfoluna butyratoxydans]|uniref:Uncharacterized protein n=1 Tax=Desulfoluna butyratoxydans TaxID=231438 RepID=A0A4U8YJW1_9BACT|nr:hypothetical protein MSL71_17290 [Desulfoluna butyratoxydans]
MDVPGAGPNKQCNALKKNGAPKGRRLHLSSRGGPGQGAPAAMRFLLACDFLRRQVFIQ